MVQHKLELATLGNNQIDLYLNQNRCKGIWNRKTHLAELTMSTFKVELFVQQIFVVSQVYVLNDTSINIVSSSFNEKSQQLVLFLLMIGLLIMLV